jgi:hypothetical protein
MTMAFIRFFFKPLSAGAFDEIDLRIRTLLTRLPLMHLSQTTIAAILDTGSRHIRRDLAVASFTFLCTVEEGCACRFATSDWSEQALMPLALRIVDEIGWKVVEYSARRQVVVRCTVPLADPARARCECDRGDGFVPLEVIEV